MHFDPSVLPVHEVLGKIRKFPIQLDEINKEMEGVRRLSGKDNENLKARFAQVEKSYQDLSRSLSKMKWDNDERLRELRLLKNAVASKIHQTGVSISQLKVKDDTTSIPDGAAFLETLQSINESLNKISREKMSVSDRREKKSVFSTIDDQFSIMDRALRIARKEMNISMMFTPAQSEKIAQLGKGITALIASATGNIEKVKSAYQESRIQRKIKSTHQSDHCRVSANRYACSARMAMRRLLETVDARSIAWQINVIRFKLKRLNHHAFKTYEEIQNSWGSLNKKLDALRTEVYKIIEGDDEEIKAVRRAWDDADVELEKFHNRVRSFKVVEKHKPLLSRTIVEINDLYRKDLSGLKSGSKSYFSPLNEMRLEKSAVAFQSSLNTLNAIKKEIDDCLEHPSPKNLDVAVKKLVEFQHSFSRAARDIHVLPKKAYR